MGAAKVTSVQTAARQKGRKRRFSVSPRGRPGNHPPLPALEGNQPTNTLILGFQAPEGRENTRLLFQPLRLWRSVPAALPQNPRTGDLVRKRENLAVRGTPFQYRKGWQGEKDSVNFSTILMFPLGIRTPSRIPYL